MADLKLTPVGWRIKAFSGESMGYLPYLGLTLLCASEFAAILYANQGRFIYSLDDPYIHLTLASRLASGGHYGIDPQDFSSPSSSILWPFLLVPFFWVGIGTYGPLILNMAAGLLALWLVGLIADRVLYETGSWRPGVILSSQIALHRATLVALAIPAFNLVGLVLTGMEHTLQVDFALLAALGMIDTSARRVPWYGLAAIIIGPLVRYENLAISAAALLVLLWHGHWRHAVIAGVVMTALVGAFSLFLISLGLAPLPSAVLVKTEVGEGGYLGRRLAYLRREFIDYRIMPLFILFGGWMALKLYTSRLREKEGMLAAAGLGVLGAHFIAGRFDWLSRYEPYLIAFTVTLLLYIYRNSLRELSVRLQRHSRDINRATMACVFVSTCVLFPAYILNGIVRGPEASHSIYLQQYQMHRFVTEFYRRPVAVNDIGWLGYENPDYVLDLWGLASDEARKARIVRDPAWMDRLTSRRHVGLAMIYADDMWLGPFIPQKWIRIGTLDASIGFGSFGSPQVTFFATDPAAVAPIEAALTRFIPTLPWGASFTRSAAPTDRH